MSNSQADLGSKKEGLDPLNFNNYWTKSGPSLLDCAVHRPSRRVGKCVFGRGDRALSGTETRASQDDKTGGSGPSVHRPSWEARHSRFERGRDGLQDELCHVSLRGRKERVRTVCRPLPWTVCYILKPIIVLTEKIDSQESAILDNFTLGRLKLPIIKGLFIDSIIS